MKNGTVESFYLPLESERPQNGAPQDQVPILGHLGLLGRRGIGRGS